MLPDWVSNPGPLTYESGALPIAPRGPESYLASEQVGVCGRGGGGGGVVVTVSDLVIYTPVSVLNKKKDKKPTTVNVIISLQTRVVQRQQSVPNGSLTLTVTKIYKL